MSLKNIIYKKAFYYHTFPQGLNQKTHQGNKLKLIDPPKNSWHLYLAFNIEEIHIYDMI